jgi:hypothetical protein
MKTHFVANLARTDRLHRALSSNYARLIFSEFTLEEGAEPAYGTLTHEVCIPSLIWPQIWTQ